MIERRSKLQHTLAAALPLAMLFAACFAGHPTVADSPDELADRFAAWGDEVLTTIDRDLHLRARGLYAEQGAVGEPPPTTPAFNWGAGVQLSALAAAARFDPDRYAAKLLRYADSLEQHWGVQRGIGGYDVLPRRRSVDRYYDDNAWMVLALIETYEVTGEQRFRHRAERAMRFVLSGEDARLGGGIYWRENEKNSKNTCSNAPAIVAALRLYQHTGAEAYLAAANRLYDWTREQLQDQQDGLYWDNIDLDGRVDRRKYTYNSALMIRANCLFHHVTNEPRYLKEAQRIAAAARAHWIDEQTGAVRDAGRFAHMLLEALVEVWRLDRDSDWLATVRRSVTFVHDEVQDPHGRYPKRWGRPTDSPVTSYALLDQSSAARAYFFAAATFREVGKASR